MFLHIKQLLSYYYIQVILMNIFITMHFTLLFKPNLFVTKDGRGITSDNYNLKIYYELTFLVLLIYTLIEILFQIIVIFLCKTRE